MIVIAVDASVSVREPKNFILEGSRYVPYIELIQFTTNKINCHLLDPQYEPTMLWLVRCKQIL